MSKELEALENICNQCEHYQFEKGLRPKKCPFNKSCVFKQRIEKALKEYEQLKQLKLLPYPQENGEEYRQDVVKRLMALEIFRNKKVNLEYLKCCENYEQYKTICSYWNEITKEEYDLLKEVFKLWQ